MSLAALVAVGNFYLSLLRYPICHLFGWQYRHVSGLPMIGTVFCVVGMLFLWRLPLAWLCAGLIGLFDTAGLPWFLFVILVWQKLIKPQPDNRPTDS